MIAGTFGPYLAISTRDHEEGPTEGRSVKVLALGYNRPNGASCRPAAVGQRRLHPAAVGQRSWPPPHAPRPRPAARPSGISGRSRTRPARRATVSAAGPPSGFAPPIARIRGCAGRVPGLAQVRIRTGAGRVPGLARVGWFGAAYQWCFAFVAV